MRLAAGWHSGDAGVCLGSAWSNGAAGAHSCGILRLPEWRCQGGCELRLVSTPRYRLVCNWFPAPGGGLSIRGLGLSSVHVQGDVYQSTSLRQHAKLS